MSSEDTDNLIGRQTVYSGLESTGYRIRFINQFNIEQEYECIILMFEEKQLLFNNAFQFYYGVYSIFSTKSGR